MNRIVRALLITAAGIGVVGVVVPHVTADRFGAGAQRALEASLGRHVKIGKVRFDLFNGPGFTIGDVEVADDPAFSNEPILYAKSLTAVPRILPLFAGRLAFSSVILEDAHINLGRADSAARPASWNVQPLLRPALFQAFPNVKVNSGRINFKLGDMKTVFYILTDKFEVRPPASGEGPWSFRLEGEPARTDRPARGFGAFTANGRWYPNQGSVDMDVVLDRSELSDMIALLNDHDGGIHGSVSGKAHVAGPLQGLGINGKLDIRGIHGWDQMAAGQDWPLLVAGTWNVNSQVFELHGRLASEQKPRVNAHFRVADYLGLPRWNLLLTFQATPLQPVLPLARQIGVPVPPGLDLSGQLDGAINLARQGAIDGAMVARGASFSLAGNPNLSMGDVQLVVDRGHLRIAPIPFHTGPDDDATVAADYDSATRLLSAAFKIRNLDSAGIRRYAELAGVPVVSYVTSGSAKGTLSLEATAAAGPLWTGSMDLQGATAGLPMLSLPLVIGGAHVDLSGPSLAVSRIQARCGDLAISGSYAYDADAPSPHQFHLSVPKARGGDLEDLFRPALNRGGIVSRALGRSSTPDWLLNLRANGVIEFGSLTIGDAVFEKVKSRVVWTGPQGELTDAQAHLSSGMVTGNLKADLSAPRPVYHGEGELRSLLYRGSKMDATVKLDTSGLGTEALSNLHTEGTFQAHNLDIYRSVTGRYKASWKGKADIQMNEIELMDGTGKTTGSASTDGTGGLVVSVEGSARKLRIPLP